PLVPYTTLFRSVTAPAMVGMFFTNQSRTYSMVESFGWPTVMASCNSSRCSRAAARLSGGARPATSALRASNACRSSASSASLTEAAGPLVWIVVLRSPITTSPETEPPIDVVIRVWPRSSLGGPSPTSSLDRSPMQLDLLWRCCCVVHELDHP